MKIIIILKLAAVLDTLPPESDLFASLRSFHESQRNAKLAEFQIIDDSEKSTWKDYLPHLGVGYNLQGKPVPTASYNFSEKVETDKRRKTEKLLRGAKINSINLQADMDFKADSLTLVSILKRLEIFRSSLRNAEENQKIDDKIFEIQKQKWREKLITDIQFLEIELQYVQRAETLRQKEESVQLLEIDALKCAKY